MFTSGALDRHVKKELSTDTSKHRLIETAILIANEFSSCVPRDIARALLSTSTPISAKEVQKQAIALLGGEKSNNVQGNNAEIFTSMLAAVVACTELSNEMRTQSKSANWAFLSSRPFEQSAVAVLEMIEEYICDLDFIGREERADRTDELLECLSKSHVLKFRMIRRDDSP